MPSTHARVMSSCSTCPTHLSGSHRQPGTQTTDCTKSQRPGVTPCPTLDFLPPGSLTVHKMPEVETEFHGPSRRVFSPVCLSPRDQGGQRSPLCPEEHRGALVPWLISGVPMLCSWCSRLPSYVALWAVVRKAHPSTESSLF